MTTPPPDDDKDDDVKDEPTAPVPLLSEPADGIPDVVSDERGLLRAAEALAAGRGPVAVDAERASGYRYGQHAYLVQLRRRGAGTWLLDPVGVPDLNPVAEALEGTEWVLHAATQDIPCLAELGLRPSGLFDTELGGRLAGLPRVGLAAVVEHYLGVGLAKEHSAVDWSTRPLPEPWLRYAALDVEVLLEVRDRMAADLAEQGKLEWAQQEFEALTRFTGPPVRSDPWRRVSGMHKVRNRRGAALVRELWLAREAIAQDRDTAPGRVLPDAALVDLALRAPRSATDLLPTAPGGPRRGPHKGLRRYQRRWLEAIERARALPEPDLPPLTVRSDAPPPVRAWPDRDPVAAARLADARAALAVFAEDHRVPVENLLTPDHLRRLLWPPAPPPDEAAVVRALEELGARPWQVEISAPVVLRALADHPDDERADDT